MRAENAHVCNEGMSHGRSLDNANVESACLWRVFIFLFTFFFQGDNCSTLPDFYRAYQGTFKKNPKDSIF